MRGSGLSGERLGAVEQFVERGFVEAMEDQHLAARLSSAAFNSKLGFSVVAPTSMIVPSSTIGQEAVLLGAIEAVDLVDEQQGALAGLGHLARLGEDLLQVRDTREHRRQRHEAQADGVGEQAGDGGLAGARRPPQDHRRQLARRDHPADRAVEPVR